MAAQDCFAAQLIDGDGEFNVHGLENFMLATNLADRMRSYLVVAIMGPQHGGKSTLMNKLFGTKFKEMDARNGRSKTTEGVWIAKSPVILEPFIIAMDLEGTDGRERGEDDTAFEKRSALFALVAADIVIINMWSHDVGREQAGNKPLLKTVFQVMMQVFGPRKTTLLFVLRDKTKIGLHHLDKILREDLQKIWEQIAKPPAHRNTPLSAFFNVEVTALSSYEAEEEHFNNEVDQLRQRFFNSTSLRGLAGERMGAVPASGFSVSAQQYWNTIRENKELDIPAHKVLVAAVRCEEIANELLDHLNRDEGWLELNVAALSGPVSRFRDRFLCILNTYLQEYDRKTMYFDEGVRCTKRRQLQSRALDLAHPAFAAILGHLRSTVLEEFKRRIEQILERGEGFNASVRSCIESCMDEFGKGIEDAAVANWDASKTRESLQVDIKKYALSLQKAKLTDITSRSKNKVTQALCEPIGSLFEAGGEGTWASARMLFIREVDVAISELSNAVACFELDNAKISTMKENLREHARNMVKEKAKEEAKKVELRMYKRFSEVFNRDDNSMPRVWTGKEDIKAITIKARSASLELLSVMTAIRLGKNSDNIRNILFASLIDGNTSTTIDRLASNSWDEVCSEDMLIKPVECKSLWKKFIDDTDCMVNQAMAGQKAYKWEKTVDLTQALVQALGTTLAASMAIFGGQMSQN